MKILIVGSGARENALGWKFLSENPKHAIAFYPGNAGTGLIGKNLVRRGGDGEIEAAKTFKPDLIVVGPEAPLAAGLVNNLEALGFKAFGPGREAAKLEASKIFAKDFMDKHEIPTARYKAFDNASSALKYLETEKAPIVIKADGLAQGKGAIVAQTSEEAHKVIADFMKENRLGDAGKRVVIEEFLEGEELSVQAFFDGSHFVYLPPARDHKRLTPDPASPMTGGMGVAAPLFPPRSLWETIDKEIASPFRRALEKENIQYSGLIYFGLMLTSRGPKVLEFNVRFGDPETQALMPLLEIPLTELMEASRERLLSRFKKDELLERLEGKPRHSLCVTLASPGYPHKPQTGAEIKTQSGLFEKSLKPGSDFLVFHAGTKLERGRWLTSGGRVLSCVGVGRTMEEARQKAYRFENLIQFEGMQYRKDIGEHVEVSV